MAFVINGREVAELMRQSPNKAEGCKRVLAIIRHGLKEKKFTPESVSLKGLGLGLGAIDAFDMEGSLRRCAAEARSTEKFHPESFFSESNPGLLSNAFQTITAELVNFAIIEGYNNTSNFIGDQLVTVVPVSLRSTKIPGVTSLGGPSEVAEGHPYPETAFEDKYVTTKESKKGRILSLSEEAILFDQTGMIMMKARESGFEIRQERERVIVRGVQDADGSANYVYRPSGTGTSLYPVAGTNMNYIGASNTVQGSPFASAVTLEDWTDIDLVLTYRALHVKDDRIDGTKRPIAGLSGPDCILLVPEKLRSRAYYIANATEVQKNTNTAVDETRFPNPVKPFIGGALSSPFVDEVNGDNWYYGNFKKQFIWTEIWPLQTFTQGADSEAAFERDTVFRVKARYYGGISARDTRYVTMVDGA